MSEIGFRPAGTGGRIDAQLDAGFARIYVPDICIAEAFKVLAKKYYSHKWFPSAVSYGQARS